MPVRDSRPNYSASSEVLSLLQFATRLDAWASTQPAGFQGSREWGALAADFRRLSAAYNSALLRPGQKALGEQARRLNDAELATAAATVEKNMDAFRKEYDSALAANTNLTPASRKTAIQNVDAMKNSARALNTALGKKQKGIAEANALLKGSAVMIDSTLSSHRTPRRRQRGLRFARTWQKSLWPMRPRWARNERVTSRHLGAAPVPVPRYPDPFDGAPPIRPMPPA